MQDRPPFIVRCCTFPHCDRRDDIDSSGRDVPEAQPRFCFSPSSLSFPCASIRFGRCLWGVGQREGKREREGVPPQTEGRRDPVLHSPGPWSSAADAATTRGKGEGACGREPRGRRRSLPFGCTAISLGEGTEGVRGKELQNNGVASLSLSLSPREAREPGKDASGGSLARRTHQERQGGEALPAVWGRTAVRQLHPLAAVPCPVWSV